MHPPGGDARGLNSVISWVHLYQWGDATDVRGDADTERLETPILKSLDFCLGGQDFLGIFSRGSPIFGFIIKLLLHFINKFVKICLRVSIIDAHRGVRGREGDKSEPSLQNFCKTC